MKILSIFFKGLFIISCSYGLSLTLGTSASFDTFISYYTTQSNILCLLVMVIFFIWEFVGHGRNPRFLRVLKSMTTVSILVTFLIYHFLLRPNIEPDMINVSRGLGNIIVHYITPLWFFLDYLIFDRKGTSRLTDSFLYTIFPLYYFVFSNIHAINGDLYMYGTTTSQFPYPFLDYNVFGIYGVSAAVVIITAAVLILGMVFVYFDNIMKKPEQRYQTHLYGAISLKPNIKQSHRLFRSKEITIETKSTETTTELPQDTINDLFFPDADQ
jgi:hypothetical protein